MPRRSLKVSLGDRLQVSGKFEISDHVHIAVNFVFISNLNSLGMQPLNFLDPGFDDSSRYHPTECHEQRTMAFQEIWLPHELGRADTTGFII